MVTWVCQHKFIDSHKSSFKQKCTHRREYREFLALAFLNLYMVVVVPYCRFLALLVIELGCSPLTLHVISELFGFLSLVTAKFPNSANMWSVPIGFRITQRACLVFYYKQQFLGSGHLVFLGHMECVKPSKDRRRNTSYLVCFLSDVYIVIFFCYITLLQFCCFFVFKTNTSLVWLAKLYFVMVMVLVFYWMKNLLTLHSCRQENLLALISIALICEFHSLNYKKKIYYQGFKSV